MRNNPNPAKTGADQRSATFQPARAAITDEMKCRLMLGEAVAEKPEQDPTASRH